MEWVETTGKTIEEAKEAALDELGVDEQDAEFEVLEEPKVGLFGRVRSEGRIRARVRPTTPRAKDDRRDRRRKPKGEGAGAGAEGAPAAAAITSAASIPSTASAASVPPAGEADAESSAGRPRTNPTRRRGGRGGARPAVTVTAAADGDAASSPAPDAALVAAGGPADGPATPRGDDTTGRAPSARNRNRSRAATRTSSAAAGDDHTDRTDAREGTLMDVALDEQGKVAEQFLLGLLDSFALPAQVVVTVPDDDTIDIQVTGEDLGLLIGPKGSTLLSIQDLTRTVVQRKTSAGNGRIFVDIAGYRQKRNEALARFAQKVAADVLATQARIAMEPMSAPDRKTVHDAITDIEGVETVSEGEDDQRHVVVVPAHI